MNVKYGKDDLKFLMALLACLFVFYPKLFLARSGFLVADHLWQHYPWAELLWKSVREFRLPFWTPLIHCGFPIAAESQIGVFYPINLLLYLLLPLNWAHSYMTLFHFLLSGGATYFYARQVGLKALGSFIVAFLFLFGASHGGAFYNITSLKTIAWFPLGLFLFERVYQGWHWRYLASLSLIFAMTLVAGYMQFGVLCLFMFMIYAFLRVVIFRDTEKNGFIFWFKISSGLALSILLAIALASPQIWLTYQLAMLSNRVGAVEEYAYVGSMFPGAAMTLFFPHWYGLFRGNSLYIGIFSLFLVMAAFHGRDVPLKRYLKLWCVMGGIAFLMALGQWSPLYVAFVKWTHFYSFRTPAKFILFVCLSLAFLGGLGFQKLWEDEKNGKISAELASIAKRFLAVCLFFVASAGLLFLVLKFEKGQVLKVGDWLIASFFYGKAGHPHTFETYQALFESSVDYFLSLFSFRSWTIWNAGMIFTGIVFCVWLMGRRRVLRGWLAAGFLFLFVDLYGFASMMFKKGFNDYPNLEIRSPVIQSLADEHGKGSVSRVFGFNYQWKLLPVLPSLNMHYGWADIGAYSPLVMKRYYETIGQMGNVDDSNFPYWPEPEFVMNHLNLLKLTGVSHLLSLVPFVHNELELLAEDREKSLFLYRFKPGRSKAFFVTHLEVVNDWGAVKKIIMDPAFDPFSVVVVEKSETAELDFPPHPFPSPPKGERVWVRGLKPEFKITFETAEPEFERWHITTNSPGYFVVANSYYPGWRAWVNGKSVPILKAYGLFQAVPIREAGSNIVEFRFSSFV